MRFVTLQGYNLRTFNGPIELDLGTYRNHDFISRCQRRLYDQIGSDQVVWCGQTDPCLHNQSGKYIHDIEVDERDIIKVVDGLVWCHILNYGERYIPDEEHTALRSHAAVSDGDYETTLRQAEDEYLSKHLPEDLWANVTRDSLQKDSDQLLLAFPILYSAIQCVTMITDQMAEEGRRQSHRTGS